MRLYTGSRLQRAGFFALKSLTVTLKGSVTTNNRLQRGVSLHHFTRCKQDPVFDTMPEYLQDAE